MSKKSIGTVHQPRRGRNSNLLCDQFILGVEEAGHQAETILLRDKEINSYMACDSCQMSGGICVPDDDMVEVRDKMIATD